MKRYVLGFVCYILVTVSSFADSYTNILPAGVNLIANQLDHGSNTFTELFPNADGSLDGDVIQLYGCTNYTTYYFDSSSPTGFVGPDDATPVPPGVLAPGQGAIYFNNQGATKTVTFVGTPHVQVLPIALPCGLGQTNFLSRPTKGLGTYENVTGYLPQAGAIVQTWNGVSFEDYFFTGGAWSPSEPILPVGQSAFFIVPFGSVPVPTYTLNLQAGYNLIANQLDQGGNTLAEILPAAPDGSVIYKYNNTNATWSGASYSTASGAWTPSTLALNPGEGAFFQSPTNFTVSITGTPHVPILPANLPIGATYLLSRQTNDVGNYENIVGTYPLEEAAVYRWDAVAQQYVTNEFLFGAWSPSPGEPTLAIGEAAWISSAATSPPTIAIAPIIVGQPTNLTVQLGDPATFAVNVASAAPPAYQWFFNHFPVPGATNGSFTIASAQTNNQGAYNVLVSNAFGAVASTVAYLTNNELEVKVNTPGITNCCWTFTLNQLFGSPGDITRIHATLQNAGSGVITSATVAPPTSFQETTLSATDVIFATTNSNGLLDGLLKVTICFSNIPPTNANLVFTTTPQSNYVSVSIIDYGGCGSVVQVSTNVPLSPGCCAAKSWNLQGPFPGIDYTFLDTNFICGPATQETLWPAARYAAAMTFDEQTNGFYPAPNVLLFGGADSNGTPTNDTWLWNGGWQSTGCNPTIPPRCSHAMAYDPLNGNTVLFGGNGGINGYLGDTWVWNLGAEAWQQTANESGAPSPSPRFGHAMVYDPTTKMIVLFGGLGGAGLLGDIWLWDGTGWTSLPLTGPSPRQGHGMAYDPNFGAIVLFGGTDSNGVEADMWKLTNNAGIYAWTKVTQSGAPPRTGHGMIYDPSCAQIEVFGGFDSNGNPLGDTWEYSDATETWSQALNIGTTPAPRGAVAAAYYPGATNFAFAIFGGNASASSTTNFSNNANWAPTNDFTLFYNNPNPVNNGVNSNYTPCPTFITGPVWERTLYTQQFAWQHTGGGGFNDPGNHSFNYSAEIASDVPNTFTNGVYPPAPGATYEQASTKKKCYDTFADPHFDCEGALSNSPACSWSPVQWPIFDNFALNGDFCPGVDITMIWYEHAGWLRSHSTPSVGRFDADSHSASFADTVFPDPCGPASSYNEYLQFADPPFIAPAGTFLPGAWRLQTVQGGPSKVNLRWLISQVGVGAATIAQAEPAGELNPCAPESGGSPCKLAYFEFDQINGTELRLKARVQGPNLTDAPTLQQEGGARTFLFYVDADNNPNTGDQCCQDLGADYCVEVAQTVRYDSVWGYYVASNPHIYKWNPCAPNTNSCGAVGMWSLQSSQVYNLNVGETELSVTAPMTAVGDPQGAYSAWVACITTDDLKDFPAASEPNSLPDKPCDCRMVLTRMADTNCPYVVSDDTSQVTVGSSASIVVTFNKPMSVINPSDITISPPLALSTFLVAPGDNTLHLRPASGAWPAGCYTLTVNSTVKDVSTNYLCSPYTFNLCVPDPKFYVVDSNGVANTTFDQGANIFVNGCGFGRSSAVTLYLVTVNDVFNSGSLLADWTTTGPKRVTTDASGCLPLDTLIGMPTLPGTYKVVADTNNDGIYETNLDRVTDLCGIGLSYGQPCTNPISSSVAVWWPFSETSAAGPVNELIEADQGVVVGANTTLIPGELGQARTFNTSLPLGPGPTYVVVSNRLDFSGALSFANADFSIELWVKTTETNEAPIVDKRQFAGFPGGQFAGYYFYLLNGVPTLQLSDGNSLWVFTSSAPGAATGNWVHVAVTVDQTLFTVTNYVNGVGYSATPSLPYSAPVVTDNNADLWMAASHAVPGPAPYFIGAMDELTMYDESLSAAQVKYIYDQGANGKCAPPAATTNSISPSTNFLGNYTQFTAPVVGTNFLVSYQWYTNRIPVINNPPYIFGGQSSVLTMLASSVLQSGTITVTVSNIFGIIYSSDTPFTVVPITPASTVVGFNSAWKYLANGSNPGTNWNQRGFNDNTWLSGQGLFGTAPTNVWPYPIETAIQPPALGGPITTYYRTSFQWDGATNDVNLVTTNFIEDGAVFYVNGAEAGRLRVPANQNYQTLASPQPNPGQPETIAFPVGSLLPGINLLAVEVHQSSASASHDVFGLGLTANVSISFIPSLSITNSGGNTTVSWSGPGTLQSTPNLAVPWSNLPAISPYTAPITNGIRFYRLHVP